MLLADWTEAFNTQSGPWRWMGDLHVVTPPPVTGLIVTLAAVVCGLLIGAERERKEKPAGVRTMILICLGSVIFTQASILLPGNAGDRSRIAAGIVAGVGFLGAGAIIREGGQVLGVTTGAAIWAVAAIGMVIGAGYVAAGLAFTLVVLVTLHGIRWIEAMVGGPCVWEQVVLTVPYDGGRTRAVIESIVDDFNASVADATPPRADGTCDLAIRYCRAHANHKSVWAKLAHIGLGRSSS